MGAAKAAAASAADAGVLRTTVVEFLVISGREPPPPNAEDESARDAAMARDAAALEARDAAWREAEATRRALPQAPGNERRAEKTALLPAASAI